MIWFCEYSAKQKCFHVAPGADCVNVNREMLERGIQSEFVPVGIFSSREEAILFSEKMRLAREKFG